MRAVHAYRPSARASVYRKRPLPAYACAGFCHHRVAFSPNVFAVVTSDDSQITAIALRSPSSSLPDTRGAFGPHIRVAPLCHFCQFPAPDSGATITDVVWLLRVRGAVLGDGSRPSSRPNSNHKDKSKSRANTRLHPTPAGIDSPRGSKCSAMKFAFADTRSRYTEVTAATARVLIQTSRNPTTFCANAKHSRREKPLTPVSHG
jgi:hypothetical protein